MNQNEQTTTRELLARVDQFNRALRDGDVEMYSDVFADDFLFTWSENGQVFEKPELLPNVRPTPSYNPIVDQVRVRVYERAAVANFRLRLSDDEPGTRVTFSFSYEGDCWKVIAVHSTKIIEY